MKPDWLARLRIIYTRSSWAPGILRHQIDQTLSMTSDKIKVTTCGSKGEEPTFYCLDSTAGPDVTKSSRVNRSLASTCTPQGNVIVSLHTCTCISAMSLNRNL